jgi:hypothetical protein
MQRRKDCGFFLRIGRGASPRPVEGSEHDPEKERRGGLIATPRPATSRMILARDEFGRALHIAPVRISQKPGRRFFKRGGWKHVLPAARTSKLTKCFAILDVPCKLKRFFRKQFRTCLFSKTKTEALAESEIVTSPEESNGTPPIAGEKGGSSCPSPIRAQPPLVRGITS